MTINKSMYKPLTSLTLLIGGISLLGCDSRVGSLGISQSQSTKSATKPIADLQSTETAFDDNRGTATFDPYGFQPSQWMKSLRDNLKINQISLPGSHDSGMYKVNLHNCNPASNDTLASAQTQNLDLYGQLNAGIRLFDLRPRVGKFGLIGEPTSSYGKLVSYHSATFLDLGCEGAPIKNLLDDVVKFLAENPSEFVILKITHNEAWHEITDLLDQPQYRSFRYRDNSAIKDNLAYYEVGKLRGKFITVFEGKASEYPVIRHAEGLYQFTKMDNISSPATPGINMYGGGANSNPTIALTELSKYGGLGKDYLYYIGWHTGGLSNHAQLADELNTRFIREVVPGVYATNIIPNSISMNFVSRDYVKPIIIFNFREFFNADLRGADFKDHKLTTSNFTNADLRGAILIKAQLGIDGGHSAYNASKFQPSANFTNANLAGVDLHGMNLIKVNLTSANLTDANVAGADLTGATLDGAILDGVDFRNTVGPNGYSCEDDSPLGRCVPWWPGK